MTFTCRRRWFLRSAIRATGAAALLPLSRGAQAGEPAPLFSLPGADGTVSLEALRGKVVLVDFWASWCAPCKQSFPWLSQLQARLGPRGLQVVALNLDREREAADAFLRELQPRLSAPLLVAYDSAGETPRRYRVRGMPTSVLVGADGQVLLHHAGFRDEDKPLLDAAVLSALAAKERGAK